MKTNFRKIKLTFAVLTVLITVISCEQETELTRKDGLISSPLGVNKSSTTTISNGLLKAKLDHYAYEAYAGLYDVELTPENSKIIDKTVLQAWVKSNEKNKHESINQKNQAALAEIVQQGDFHAIQVTVPKAAPFHQSVFVMGRFTAILITDVKDFLIGPGLEVVEEGFGFYGQGYLDRDQNFPCGCVKENKIILRGQPYSECGKCPDFGDL